MSKAAAMRSRFGGRVEALLSESGLSSADLAARVGLSASRVEAILRGRSVQLRLREMTLIAAAIGTPLEVLLVPAEPPVLIVPFEEVEER